MIVVFEQTQNTGNLLSYTILYFKFFLVEKVSFTVY